MLVNRLPAALALLALFVPVGARAAQPPPPSTSAAQMKKLDFLLGKWSGGGYVEYVPGRRLSFTETEDVQAKLGGFLITFEGTGKSTLPNGESAVTHSAFGVASYDENTSTYRWNAYNVVRGAAQYVSTKATVGNSTLQWGYEGGPAGTFQFTIHLDAEGRWVETGSLSRDGKTWRKFFQMTLQRVSTSSQSMPD